MKLGQRIRYLREERGDTRKELAQRAGISEDHLKKIESGKRKVAIVNTLLKIARALEVSTDLLLCDDELLVVNKLSRRDFEKIGLIGTAAVIALAAGDIDQDKDDPWSEQHSPEAWIARGDAADGRGEWQRAMEYYLRAIALLPRGYPWARCMVEKVAQMQINQGAYVLAEVVFSKALKVIDECATDEANRDLIRGLIAEKQGWIENYRGNHDMALERFHQALAIAQRRGDIRLEGTSHHFLGRVAIEGQAQCLYPELLQFQKPGQRILASALAEVRKAKEMDSNSDPNVAFGLRCEALGSLMLNQPDDAKRLLHECVRLLQGWDAAQAQALVGLRLIETLEAKHAWHARSEYTEIAESITELLEPLSSQNHSYAYVEALVTLLHANYLAEKHRRSSTDRRRCADLCIVSMLLHNEPGHRFSRVSRELLSRFIQAMDDKETANYRRDLPARLMEYGDEFMVLNRFTPPTLSAVHAVLDTLDKIGQSQGKALKGRAAD